MIHIHSEKNIKKKQLSTIDTKQDLFVAHSFTMYRQTSYHKYYLDASSSHQSKFLIKQIYDKLNN